MIKLTAEENELRFDKMRINSQFVLLLLYTEENSNNYFWK